MACSLCKEETHDKRSCPSPRGQVQRWEAMLEALDLDEGQFRTRYAPDPVVERVFQRRREEIQATIQRLGQRR